MNAQSEKEAEYGDKETYNGEAGEFTSDAGSQDGKDMARMGKKQEFSRNFNWISSVGFTSCTMGTWEFVALNTYQMLVDGGLACMFWSYTWVIVGQFFIVLSLAEMSSMAPTAGGQVSINSYPIPIAYDPELMPSQYHWVSEFAPRKYQKPLSYTSGWLSSLCWQSFVASDCLYSAQLIMSVASIANPDFVPKTWQTALISILIGAIVTAINVLGAKRLALVENVFVMLHVAGFFIVLITIAVVAPMNSAHDVFLKFSDNGGGYPTSEWMRTFLALINADKASIVGLGVMVGQVPAMWNVLASDAVAHLCTFSWMVQESLDELTSLHSRRSPQCF